MAYSIFVLDIVIAFVIAAALLWRYSDWMRQPVMVTIAVLIAWYFSFLIVFVIPLDVSNTIYTNSNCSWGNESLSSTTTSRVSNSSVTTTFTTSTASTPTTTPVSSITTTESSSLSRSQRSVSDQCSEPASYIPSDNIYSLWRIVYWSSQLLTWLVLPLMQSFTQAGEFTFTGKLRSSVWDNMIYYTSYIFIAIILIIYIALQPNLHLDWLKLKAIAASASNTWGLFLLVFLMGYGLVEVPRTLWFSSKRGYSLNQAYFKISKLWGERNDAEGSLEEVLISVEGVRRKFDSEGGSPLQQFIDIIVSKVPTEMLERVGRRVRAAEEGMVTEASLAKLHKQVMVAVTAHHRTEAQWQHMVDKVLWLEDNMKNSDNADKVFRRQYGPGTILTPQLEWYVRCMIVPRLLQLAAVSAALLSVLLTWSEVTFFSDSPTLSIFAVLIQSAANSNHYRTIEIVSFLTIFYMSICTFYTVFKVRVLNYYYLASNHQSDSYTLLFSGALLSRITPALCLNFLSVVHMDSHIILTTSSETAYTRVMGHMDVVSIVQDGFNIYFPMLLIVLTLATYFSLGSRLLSFLGFQQFLETEEITGEFVEEGRELVKREKRRRERLEQSGKSTRRGEEVGGVTSSESSAARQRVIGASNVKYSDNRDTAGVDSEVTWNNTETRNKEPPRNLFDDL